MKMSAVICTHNPRPDYLASTLASIRSQQIADTKVTWELLIIDNKSDVPLEACIDLTSANNVRIIREDRLGLTFARLRSFEEARGEVILFIDDDNVLAPNYVENVLTYFDNSPHVGAIGGKSIPVYENSQPHWFPATGLSLACRDLGDEPIEGGWSDPIDPGREYPDFAPIGAGMAVRRSAYQGYVKQVELDARRTALGRRGADLASGEDNDMIMSILEQGWKVAYRPELVLHHLIPATRLTQDYLERYARSSNRTWVQVLDLHGIRPWSPIARWTLPVRLARAYIRGQAWRSPAASIRFMGQRGLFEGRALIGP